MTNQQSITTLLAVLDQYLFTASGAAKDAHEAILAGEQNIAIGTLLPVERQCEDALALLRAILSLHRHGRDYRAGGAR